MIENNYLYSMCYDKNEVYFVNRGWEGVLKYSISDNNLTCCSNYWKSEKGSNEKKIIVHGKILITFPINGNVGTIEFSLLTNGELINRIEIDYPTYFDGYYIKGDVLFIFNNWSVNPALFVIDLNKYKLKKIVNLEQYLKKEFNQSCRPLTSDIVINGNSIYVAHEHLLLEISIQNYLISVNDIECTIGEFVLICHDNNGMFWLFDRYGKGIGWNNKQLKVLNIQENILDDIWRSEVIDSIWGYTESYQLWNHAFYIGEYIYFIPGRINKILRYNLINGKWEVVIKLCANKCGVAGSLCNTLKLPEKIIVFLIEEKRFVIINKDGIRQIEPNFKISNIEKIIYDIVVENPKISCTLNDFLEKIECNSCI